MLGRPGVAGRPELRQRARLAGILDLDRQGESPRRSHLATRDRASPGWAPSRTRPVSASTMPGTTTPTPSHRPRSSCPARMRLDAFREAGDEPLVVAFGRIAGDAGELPAEQVGHHHERARRPDVDGDDASLARIDVEKRRLAAALRFARGALEHGAVRDQLIDQQADGAAADPHQPREVGARDRLVDADEIQGDPAVDLARGAAGGEPQVSRMHGSHLSFEGPIYASGRRGRFVARDCVASIVLISVNIWPRSCNQGRSCDRHLRQTSLTDILVAYIVSNRNNIGLTHHEGCAVM